MLLGAKKVVPMALFTPSEGKNKRGKRGGNKEFLDIFCQDSRKKSKKTWIERRGICTVLAVQSMVLCRSTAQTIPLTITILQANIILSE